jgi:membrane protein
MSNKEETLRTRIRLGGEAPGLAGTLWRSLRVVVLLLESFKRNALTGRAASLAFISAMAFVPSFVVLGSAVPAVQHRVRIERIETLFAGPVALSSALVLAALVLWMMIVFERTLGAMWGIRKGRALLRRIIAYWSVLSAGTLAAVATLGAVPFLLDAGLSGWLREQVSFLNREVLIALPFVTSSGALFLAFLLLPGTHVPVRAALFGGIAGGFLWEALKIGTLTAADWLGTEASPYAVLAAGPVFLLWIHLGWVMILLGAGVAYGVQHCHTQRRELDLPPASQQLKERLAVRVTLLASRSFVQGIEAPTIEELASGLELPLRPVSQVVYQLILGGVLKELARGEQKGSGLVPATDPQRISVQDAVDAVRRYGVNAGKLPEDEQGRELEDLLADSWDKAAKNLARVNFRELAEASAKETVVRKRA